MFDRKQFRILIIAVAALLLLGSVYFAVKNKVQSGTKDDGTLAFTTEESTYEGVEITTAESAGKESESKENEDSGKSPEESESNESDGTEEEPESEKASASDEEEPGSEKASASDEEEPESEKPSENTEIAGDEPDTEETGTGTETASETAPPDGMVHENGISVTPDGEYTDKDHVALYIHAFGHLPSNYITKAEAEELGWVAQKGNLWEVAPGKSIGGSHFGNYEKLLPTKKGRKYFECDIDYKGKSRGAKRIIYSNDGLIYYTSDHYESFEQLY